MQLVVTAVVLMMFTIWLGNIFARKSRSMLENIGGTSKTILPAITINVLKDRRFRVLQCGIIYRWEGIQPW